MQLKMQQLCHTGNKSCTVERPVVVNIEKSRNHSIMIIRPAPVKTASPREIRGSTGLALGDNDRFITID